MEGNVEGRLDEGVKWDQGYGFSRAEGGSECSQREGGGATGARHLEKEGGEGDLEIKMALFSLNLLERQCWVFRPSKFLISDQDMEVKRARGFCVVGSGVSVMTEIPRNGRSRLFTYIYLYLCDTIFDA